MLGCKTDVNDVIWLVDFLVYGLIRVSFVLDVDI